MVGLLPDELNEPFEANQLLDAKLEPTLLPLGVMLPVREVLCSKHRVLKLAEIEAELLAFTVTATVLEAV